MTQSIRQRRALKHYVAKTEERPRDHTMDEAAHANWLISLLKWCGLHTRA